MQKLNKDQEKRLEKISQQLGERHEALEAALAKYNEVVAQAWEKHVTKALGDYNDALQEGMELRDEVVEAIAGHIENKSEKWQESAKGQAFIDWQSAWEDLDLEPLDLDKPEEIEMPECPSGETFDDVPHEVES